MKQKLACFALTLVVLMTMLPALAAAEDVPTISVMLIDNGRSWDPTVSNNAAIQ